MKYSFVWLILFLLADSYPGSSQDSVSEVLHYEVNRLYPPLSLTKEQLKEAQSLMDLNPYYKPSWVKEYISVEILTYQNGQIRKAVSQNNTLSLEQKDIMLTADLNTDISVIVRYIPENTLSQNDAHEFPFSFIIDPGNDASYAGGLEELMQFLKQKAIDKIPAATFKGYDMAAVTFTVDEEGHIIDPHIFWSSNNEKVDTILLDGICNMPDWKPAAYANGLKVKQEFVLTVGNMENCMVNLLNIRKDSQ